MPQNTAAILYGAGLGVGIATYIPFSTFYVLPVSAVFNGSAALGAALLGAFGLGRVFPIIWLNLAPPIAPDVEQVTEVLRPFRGAVAYFNAFALAFVASYLFVAAFSF